MKATESNAYTTMDFLPFLAMVIGTASVLILAVACLFIVKKCGSCKSSRISPASYVCRWSNPVGFQHVRVDMGWGVESGLKINSRHLVLFAIGYFNKKNHSFSSQLEVTFLRWQVVIPSR